MDESDIDLSILEYGYTSSDGRLAGKLAFSLSLAQLAEERGYSRFWFTEHHSSNLGVACPEVVMAAVAARTKRIRVGSAGILLNHYSPFKVAEMFHTLGALFPGRIDVGLARGVGGGPEVVGLVRDRTPEPSEVSADADVFERKTRDMLRHLRAGQEADREKAGAPPADMPEIWLMGTGTSSAALAAKLGTRLAMQLWCGGPDRTDVEAVLADYKVRFRRAPDGPKATGCITLGGICAETDAEAQAMLAAARERVGQELVPPFCGTPEHCRETIVELCRRHRVREAVIHAQYCAGDRQMRMFELLADAMLRGKC